MAVCRPEDPPAFSRFVCGRVERTDAWTEQEAQVEALLEHAAKAGGHPALYYGGDPELLIVSRYRDALKRRFRFVVAERTVLDDCLDKVRFGAMATRLGLPVPKTFHLRPASDAVPGELPLPAVVKPLTRHQRVWEPVGASAKAIEVRTEQELAAAWRELADAELEVVAQELVEGPEAAVESYHAYLDGDMETVAEFTGRKIRTLPPRFGHSTALTTTDASDVRELGRHVMSRIGADGLVKVDFKRDASGGLHLLEVNLRFSLWHHLGAVAGVNLPALVHADLSGQPRPRVGRARPGVTWSLPWQDLRAARAVGMPLREWLGFLRRCEARSGMSLDDPLPFVRGQLERRLRRGLGALRRPS